MNNSRFKTIEAAKEGRKKVHPILAVILSVVFLTLGELFILFMLFLPKAETTFMKGIYNNLEMLLTFGGATVIVFLWVRFVEKRPFSSIGFGKEQFLRKYLKGAIVGFIFISIPVLLLVITGFVQLQIQPITTTVIFGICNDVDKFICP